LSVIHSKQGSLVDFDNLAFAAAELRNTAVNPVAAADKGHFILWGEPAELRMRVLGL